MNDTTKLPEVGTPIDGSASATTAAATLDAPALKLGWQRVVLVCRQCQKRSSGPSKLKAKAVVSALKAGTRRGPLRTRIALTGCLGPCPKKAITVALPATDRRRATGWAIARASEALALGKGLAREGGDEIEAGPV